MIKIKDMEEKRLTVAYFMSRNKKVLCPELVWEAWIQWWKEDFTTDDGAQLLMFNGFFVLPRTEQGIPKPHYCKEYDEFLHNTLVWIREHSKGSRKANNESLMHMLTAHREENSRRLFDLFEQKNLQHKGYKLLDHTAYRKHPLRLGRFSISHRDYRDKNKTCVVDGSYETVLDYINNK